MSPVLLLLALWAAPARAAVEPVECPSGTTRALTDDPYVPFKCVKDGEDVRKGFDAVTGPKGFKMRPRCPKGTRPVASDNSLQPYRCVRSIAGETEPDLAPMHGDEEQLPVGPAEVEEDPLTRGCPVGKRKVRTNDPLHPFQCVIQSVRVNVLDEGSFTNFSIPHQLSFDYPRAFRMQDAWKEDVPTLYLRLEQNTAGKPVTITVTRYDQGQSSYQELETAVARDVEWQGAKDGGEMPLAGTKAHVTYVPSDTRTVYLPVNKQSYYSFVYSAGADSYETYLPAFHRLLRSLKLGNRR